MVLFLITIAIGFICCAIARAACVPLTSQRDDERERLYQLRLI
jgi:hypothetical protein